jgi:alpha-tubulin suppressor-like RCC1 family protein
MITDDGKVITSGSNEHGQLGLQIDNDDTHDNNNNADERGRQSNMKKGRRDTSSFRPICLEFGVHPRIEVEIL